MVDGERKNCPLIATKGPHCDAHAREHEQRRGSKQSRGYDRAYDQARLRWAPEVLAGLVDCWRCGNRIDPGDDWHLGHDDGGRIAGPEHASSCNLRAAALKSKGIDWYPKNPSGAARPAPESSELRQVRGDRQARAEKAARRRTERLRRLGREDEI